MTVLEFSTTTTRTRLIPSRFGERFLQVRVFSRQREHHLCRGAIAPQQLGHDTHWLIDVYEERLVASAQVIQSSLANGCLNETVLGAPAVTGEAHFALTTVTLSESR